MQGDEIGPIRIGRFWIVRCDLTSVWIQKEGAEGMQTSDDALESAINEFFDKNF